MAGRGRALRRLVGRGGTAGSERREEPEDREDSERLRVLRRRLRRLQLTGYPIVQTAVAAAIAWAIAQALFPSRAPFFAPIAAVVTLGVSLSQRLRRTLEVMFGVAIGVLIGDLLILGIGTGSIQVAVVVALAMVVAVLLGGGTTLIMQAAASAVLVATLEPGTNDFYYVRFIDALVGGSIGILVNTLIMPLNPIKIVRRAADPVLDELALALETVATATWNRDLVAAQDALQCGSKAQDRLGAFTDTLDAGREISRIAPVRWSSQEPLHLYLNTAEHLEGAVRNVRVLLRRTTALLSRGESVPPGLPAALDSLARAIRAIRLALDRGEEPKAARAELLSAADQSARSLAGANTLSGQVIVAQIRSMAVDLLEAAGLDHTRADRAVREAVQEAQTAPVSRGARTGAGWQ